MPSTLRPTEPIFFSVKFDQIGVRICVLYEKILWKMSFRFSQNLNQGKNHVFSKVFQYLILLSEGYNIFLKRKIRILIWFKLSQKTFSDGK